MGHATNIDPYLFPNSKLGKDKLTETVKIVKKVVLTFLQILGLAILSTFGMWPAVAYLLYLSMTT